MIAVFADALRSLSGVWRLVLGRQGYEAYFDVTADGVRRSFFAAAIAAPVFLFVTAAQRQAAVALDPAYAADVEGVSFARTLALFAVQWLHFPLIAPFLADMLAAREGLGRWIAVHNWAMLLVFLPQGLLWAVYTAFPGAIDPATPFMIVMQVVLPLSLFIHWRVATLTLNAPMGIALAATCAHVLFYQVAQLGVARLFDGSGAAG